MALKGRYRHFKGDEYEVVGNAKHSETLEDMVIYKQADDNNCLWVRPADMWAEEVEYNGKNVKRFINI